MKAIQTGTRLTAASILFTVAVAFAILAALSNPITAAPLILTLLTLGSVALSMALFTAVVIQTYRQKPGITLETFKGAYIELSYYHIRSALSKLKEKIENYFATAQQEERSHRHHNRSNSFNGPTDWERQRKSPQKVSPLRQRQLKPNFSRNDANLKNGRRKQ